MSEKSEEGKRGEETGVRQSRTRQQGGEPGTGEDARAEESSKATEDGRRNNRVIVTRKKREKLPHADEFRVVELLGPQPLLDAAERVNLCEDRDLLEASEVSIASVFWADSLSAYFCRGCWTRSKSFLVVVRAGEKCAYCGLERDASS